MSTEAFLYPKILCPNETVSSSFEWSNCHVVRVIRDQDITKAFIFMSLNHPNGGVGTQKPLFPQMK